jgi:hypothetical protein
MNVSVNARQKVRQRYHVYYNDWTGEIISIGHSVQKNSLAPFFVTDDNNAMRIVNGKDSDTHYIVNTETKTPALILKSEVLQMRKQENNLFLLPSIVLSEWDIRVKLYKENNRLVVEANQAMIGRLLAYHMRQKIQVTNNQEFKFYIIKNDEPDHLIKTVAIDAGELINNNFIEINVSDIINHTSLDNLSVMTRRNFKDYYFEVVDTAFKAPVKDASQHKTNKIQTVLNDDDTHIEIVQSGNRLEIISKVVAKELNAIATQTIKVFVTSPAIDHYIDSFDIDISRIRMGQSQKFTVGFDIMDVTLIYDMPSLKISKRKMNEPSADQ